MVELNKDTLFVLVLTLILGATLLPTALTQLQQNDPTEIEGEFIGTTNATGDLTANFTGDIGADMNVTIYENDSELTDTNYTIDYDANTLNVTGATADAEITADYYVDKSAIRNIWGVIPIIGIAVFLYGIYNKWM